MAQESLVSRVVLRATIIFVTIFMVLVLIFSAIFNNRQQQLRESLFIQYEFKDHYPLSMHIGSTGIGRAPLLSDYKKGSTQAGMMGLDRSKRGYTIPTLVLLHDVMEGWNAFSDLIPLLSLDFSLLYPDLRGHNYTKSINTDMSSLAQYDLATILENDVLRMIKIKLEDEPHILVGHGLSGIMLYIMACDHPEYFQNGAVKGLVIVNVPHFEAIRSEMKTFTEQQQKSAYIKKLFQYKKDSKLDKLIDNGYQDLINTFSMNTDWFSSRIQYYTSSWDRQSPLVGLNWIFSNYGFNTSLEGDQFYDSFEWKFDKPSRNITISNVPILLIWGTENQFYSYNTVEETKNFVPNIRVKEIKGSYWILHETPSEVAQAIREFVVKI